jgi:hypothetical protein
MSGPKERIREWFRDKQSAVAEAHGLPLSYEFATEHVIISGLTDYPEPMLQVEYQARAAFWPRSMFEHDWEQAEQELERFFFRCVLDERHKRQTLNDKGKAGG